MTDFSAAINNDTPVLVDFYSNDSIPCSAQLRILTDVKASEGEGVKVLKVNVDKNPNVIARDHIQNVPSVLLFRNGKMLWRWSGIVLKDELLRVLHSFGPQLQTVHYESYQH